MYSYVLIMSASHVWRHADAKMTVIDKVFRYTYQFMQDYTAGTYVDGDLGYQLSEALHLSREYFKRIY
jgi:hypothetical protein